MEHTTKGLLPSGARVICSGRDLSKSFGSTNVLDNFNIDIEEGRFTLINGESGSGKTTLLMLLSGLDVPTRGTVISAGEVVTGMGKSDLAKWRQRVGFVMQKPNLLPNFSALENLCLVHGLAGNTIDVQKAREILGSLNIKDQSKPVATLSGGEQQRVAIARAAVKNPDVIFADEPTASLDSATKSLVSAALARVVDELNISVVVVSHDELVKRDAHRIITLSSGVITDDVHKESGTEPSGRVIVLDEPQVVERLV